MIRTMLASAAVAVTAGVAGAQTIIYDDGHYVSVAEPPVIVERRAAIIPTAPVIVEPADRVVVVTDFDQLSPGAPSSSGSNDEKRTVGDVRRDFFDEPSSIVVFR